MKTRIWEETRDFNMDCTENCIACETNPEGCFCIRDITGECAVGMFGHCDYAEENGCEYEEEE